MLIFGPFAFDDFLLHIGSTLELISATHILEFERDARKVNSSDYNGYPFDLQANAPRTEANSNDYMLK
jgi:hypothetical protein